MHVADKGDWKRNLELKRIVCIVNNLISNKLSTFAHCKDLLDSFNNLGFLSE